MVDRDQHRLAIEVTVGDRGSPLTFSARRAISPLNAMLTCCYEIAPAEARIAIIAAGCDLRVFDPGGHGP